MMDDERLGLFEENKGQVYYIVANYFSAYANKEELIQNGLIGLWKASKKFDDAKEIKFATYATKCICNSIRTEIRRNEKYEKEIVFCDLRDSDKDGMDEVELAFQEELPRETNEYTNFYLQILDPIEQRIFQEVASKKPLRKIATEFGVRYQTIALRYEKIRKKLLTFKNELQFENKDTSFFKSEIVQQTLNKTEISFMRNVNKLKSYKLVAAKYGITVSTVKGRVYTIRKKLKEKLSGKEFFMG